MKEAGFVPENWGMKRETAFCSARITLLYTLDARGSFLVSQTLLSLPPCHSKGSLFLLTILKCDLEAFHGKAINLDKDND